MTCKCSRQRYRAERVGRLDVTLHCLPNGNFEALQCDMGICWCADEQNGFVKPDTFAVPESLWTFLPCCKRRNYVTLLLMKTSNIYLRTFMTFSTHYRQL